MKYNLPSRMKKVRVRRRIVLGGNRSSANNTRDRSTSTAAFIRRRGLIKRRRDVHGSRIIATDAAIAATACH